MQVIHPRIRIRPDSTSGTRSLSSEFPLDLRRCARNILAGLLAASSVASFLTPSPNSGYSAACGTVSNIKLTNIRGERCRSYLIAMATSKTFEVIGRAWGGPLVDSGYAGNSGEYCIVTKFSTTAGGGGAGATAFANGGGPTNSGAVAFSSSQINLTWTAFTSNDGVTGYHIFRNGTQFRTPSGNTSYSDSGLTASPPNTFIDSTYDAASNKPAQSSSTRAPTKPGSIIRCNLNATPANFASQVSAATAGQTIVLASGNYGTWTGTNKAITITAASGASPQVKFNFGSGDANFTLNSITGMGGFIGSGASNITIRNSTFTSQLDIEGAVTNIVVEHNDFTWMPVDNGTANSKIFLNTSGSSPGAAVTIENNDIENGGLDGIHIGGGSGVLILNNIFRNLIDVGLNHTDNIQFESGSQIVVRGNYIYANGPTQGITSYNPGTNGVIIEDNVVDIPRDWGIEFYSDVNSIIRHNTVVYHPASYSSFGTGSGRIDINRKPTDPAGSGTQVYDNITTEVSFSNGSTGTAYNNVSGANAIYVGGASPTTHDGFLLASNSPVGRGAASDGADAGTRGSGRLTDP